MTLSILIAYNPINLVRSLSLDFEYPTRIPAKFPDSSKRLRLDVVKNTSRNYVVLIKQDSPCSVPNCIVGKLVGKRGILRREGQAITLRNGRTALYQDCNSSCLSSITWGENGTNYQILYAIDEDNYSDRLKQLKKMANSSLN
ncbi:hypothetical protein [Crocosphaera sp.]|uniref:hypothetical protein n=1 Tax=Crocosphaera sp. TaxID=2729996 RepID=UPI002618DC9D|nr:hypothetical protein [Crocosphaera sp.]MDJ0579658.1 hypothetical protein [Crocosphaera sp.]